jgi:hypothetical protein
MTEQQKAAQAYVEQMGLSKIASFKPSAQSDAPASSGSTTMTRGGTSSGVTGRDVTVSKPVYSPDADVQTQFATSAGSGISAVHVVVGLAALVALGIGIYAFTKD